MQSRRIRWTTLVWRETLAEEENHLIHHDPGNAYYFKFKTTLSMACLSRSVSEFKLALQAPDKGNKPPSKVDNLMTTVGLARSFMAQFEIPRQQQDIDNAILCYEECIRETTEGSSILQVQKQFSHGLSTLKDSNSQ